MKLRRTSRGCDRWTAMIYGCQEFAVLARSAFMVNLHRSRFEMALVTPALFIARGPRIDSTGAAVIADAVHCHIVNHGLVVDMNVGDRDVIYAAVVVERPILPI